MPPWGYECYEQKEGKLKVLYAQTLVTRYATSLHSSMDEASWGSKGIKKRQTHGYTHIKKLRFCRLGSLVEKLQHSGVSLCLFYMVDSIVRLLYKLIKEVGL